MVSNKIITIIMKKKGRNKDEEGKERQMRCKRITESIGIESKSEWKGKERQRRDTDVQEGLVKEGEGMEGG